MIFLVLATAQAVSPAPPEKIDLTIRQSCNAKSPTNDEIVVCGLRDGRSPYRLPQSITPHGSDIPKVEVGLSEGVNAIVQTESADVGGFPSNRIMIGLKMKF
ncbi:MAG TPA: hypothetical protein VEB39_06415 [Sphingomicrobium sp.]|nr:hypothetical protein [Sphingomicrobium sp.]